METIMKKLPSDIQQKINVLNEMSDDGWSIEWNRLATEIGYLISIEKEKKTINEDELNLINKKYLKSLGSIGEGQNDFFYFLMTMQQ